MLNMGSTIEVANVALLLGVLVVVIATIKWEAGIVASLIAATALNYFCTEPIHSLRVTSGDDLLTIALLISLGVGVSVITAFRAQKTVKTFHSQFIGNEKRSIRQQLATNTPVSLVWHNTQTALSHEMELVDVRLQQTDEHSLPVIARRSREMQSEFDHLVIPQTGAVLNFSDPRLTQTLVFTPRPGVGPLSLQRDLLFLFANQVEAVLTGTL